MQLKQILTGLDYDRIDMHQINKVKQYRQHYSTSLIMSIKDNAFDILTHAIPCALLSSFFFLRDFN